MTVLDCGKCGEHISGPALEEMKMCSCGNYDNIQMWHCGDG